MSSSKTIVRMAGIWVAFLVVYAGMSLALHKGNHALTALGDVSQCIVPLLANAGLLLNAGTPQWRRNLFWMLLAMGCTLWMIGQFEWTYYELYLHRAMPDNDPIDIVFFLRGIPMMAAVTLRPHVKRGELRLRFGYLDFALLLGWWIFLYIFIVLPWMYAVPSLGEYNYNYVLLHNTENMIIVGGFGYLWLRAAGAWRVIYAHLFGASAMYMLSSLAINVALQSNRYYTGSLYDLPLVSSFLWFALAGVIAYQKRDALDAPSENEFDADADSERGRERCPRSAGHGCRHVVAAVCYLHAPLRARKSGCSRLPAIDSSYRLHSPRTARFSKNISCRCGSHAPALSIREVRRESSEAPDADRAV